MASRINSKMAFLTVSTFSLLTACGGGGGAAAVMSSAEGKYVLPNSNMLAVIDVQKLVTSKIYTDQIKPMIDANPEAKAEMEKNIAEAGIDPFKDVKTVMVSGDTDENKKVAFSVTGASTLDAAKMIAKVKEKDKDAQLEAVGANSIFGTAGDAAVFAELKKAAGVDGSPDVKALWDSVDKGGAITFVVSLKGKKIGAMVPDPTAAKATGVMGSINVTDGVAAKISVRFASADDANALKATADKQMADPGFAMVSAFAKITVSVSGTDLVVDASMSKDQINTVTGMAKGFLGGFGAKKMPEPMPGMDPGAAPGAEMPANP